MEVLRDNFNVIMMAVLTILIIRSLIRLQSATHAPKYPNKTKFVQKGSVLSIKGI